MGSLSVRLRMRGEESSKQDCKKHTLTLLCISTAQSMWEHESICTRHPMSFYQQ